MTNAKVASSFKFILAAGLSVLLSAMTLVLGAPWIRSLRKTYGPKLFWSLGLIVVISATVFKAYLFSVLLGSIWMTLGIYTEIESNRVKGWVQSLISFVTGAFVGTALLTLYSKVFSYSVMADIQESAQMIVSQIQQINPSVKVESQVLIQQAPSAFIIVLIGSLFLSLLFEKPALWFLGERVMAHSAPNRLLKYRLPDFYIWIPLVAVSIILSKLNRFHLDVVAANVVNVSLVLFFIQGFAVAESFLRFIRAGFITRTMTYFLALSYGLIIFSLVGFVDYWVDFRKRFKKRPTLAA